MRKGDREIYKKCKMDCFHCPFPDCKMSTSAPDLSGIEYTDKVHVRRKVAIEWTAEMDKHIVDGRAKGHTYAVIGAGIGESPSACRQRFIKLTKEQK